MQFLGLIRPAQAVGVGGDDQGRLGDLAQPVEVCGADHGRLPMEDLAAQPQAHVADARDHGLVGRQIGMKRRDDGRAAQALEGPGRGLESRAALADQLFGVRAGRGGDQDEGADPRRRDPRQLAGHIAAHGKADGDEGLGHIAEEGGGHGLDILALAQVGRHQRPERGQIVGHSVPQGSVGHEAGNEQQGHGPLYRPDARQTRRGAL